MNRKSFYIVDDDPHFIQMAMHLLEEKGHIVKHNTSALDAFAEIVVEKPDCVLLDIMMPEIDGLLMCKKIRSEPSFERMKIIIVTGKTYSADRERAFAFGADGYIVKPLDLNTFADQVVKTVEGSVELSFWGIRGTLPVPGEKTLKYGGNTSCVSVEFSNGVFFLFDAGSGIKVLSDHLKAKNKLRGDTKIFFSHPHWDHINSIPFFTPLFVPGNALEMLGSSHGDVTMRELISSQMDGVFFPIKMTEFSASISFRDLKEEELTINGIKVCTMLLNHPGYCLGYRVEHEGRSVCYVTDNEIYPQSTPYHNPAYIKKLAQFVKKTDALITDTTYMGKEYEMKISWGHSSVEEVVKLAHAAQVKTLYLFHHDPDQNDADIDRKLEIAQSLLQRKKSKTTCIAPRETQSIVL